MCSRSLILSAILVSSLAGGSLHAADPVADSRPHFTIMIHESLDELAKRNDTARGPAYWQSYADYCQHLTSSGVLVGGAALQPAAAGRVSDSHLDGAAAQTTTDLGGYFVIRATSLDEAFSIAARCPGAATGRVVVRPHVPMPATTVSAP